MQPNHYRPTAPVSRRGPDVQNEAILALRNVREIELAEAGAILIGSTLWSGRAIVESVANACPWLSRLWRTKTRDSCGRRAIRYPLERQNAAKIEAAHRT